MEKTMCYDYLQNCKKRLVVIQTFYFKVIIVNNDKSNKDHALKQK